MHCKNVADSIVREMVDFRMQKRSASSRAITTNTSVLYDIEKIHLCCILDSVIESDHYSKLETWQCHFSHLDPLNRLLFDTKSCFPASLLLRYLRDSCKESCDKDKEISVNFITDLFVVDAANIKVEVFLLQSASMSYEVGSETKEGIENILRDLLNDNFSNLIYIFSTHQDELIKQF